MAYIGDTPEGVRGAFWPCRHCECDEDSIQTSFKEKDFQIHLLHRHVQQCRTIDNSATESLAELYKTTYGINRRSILWDVAFFDVCQQIPPDIMHILLQGVVPYTTQLVLPYFIYEMRAMSLEELKDKIAAFNYNYQVGRSKPNSIFIETSCWTMAENWNRA